MFIRGCGFLLQSDSPFGISRSSSKAARIAPRLLTALCWYYLSLTPVLGMALSAAIIPRKPHPHSNASGILQSFANWDGVWYERILTTGYYYDPSRHSSIAFFPGYPVLAWGVQSITGLGPVPALMVVSQTCYFLLFLIVPLYLRDRDPLRELSDHTILALMFWPMTLYFRVAYTESLFVLLTVLVLMGNQRRWPLPVVALLAGFGTSVRAVGIVLALLVTYRAVCEPGSKWDRALRAVLYGGIGTWGLLAFISYQKATFNDPLAFCRTQVHWTVMPELPHWRAFLGLIILEPVWSVYVPSHPAHWASFEWVPNLLTGLQFWNPIFLMVSVALVIVGVYRRWLTVEEVILSVGLLLIPYVLQGHRMAMMGQSRFSGAVFPCYVVMGRLLMDLPPAVRTSVCASGACATTLLLALFAAWYRIF